MDGLPLKISLYSSMNPLNLSYSLAFISPPEYLSLPGSENVAFGRLISMGLPNPFSYFLILLIEPHTMMLTTVGLSQQHLSHNYTDAHEA